MASDFSEGPLKTGRVFSTCNRWVFGVRWTGGCESERANVWRDVQSACNSDPLFAPWELWRNAGSSGRPGGLRLLSKTRVCVDECVGSLSVSLSACLSLWLTSLPFSLSPSVSGRVDLPPVPKPFRGVGFAESSRIPPPSDKVVCSLGTFSQLTFTNIFLNRTRGIHQNTPNTPLSGCQRACFHKIFDRCCGYVGFQSGLFSTARVYTGECSCFSHQTSGELFSVRRFGSSVYVGATEKHAVATLCPNLSFDVHQMRVSTTFVFCFYLQVRIHFFSSKNAEATT